MPANKAARAAFAETMQNKADSFASKWNSVGEAGKSGGKGGGKGKGGGENGKGKTTKDFSLSLSLLVSTPCCFLVFCEKLQELTLEEKEKKDFQRDLQQILARSTFRLLEQSSSVLAMRLRQLGDKAMTAATNLKSTELKRQEAQPAVS